ncbi:PD-(D/E)XK motif protein [Micromonospora sp. NIE79]|uniref:PD-(D/E)XK motif protein n=1 Tax=Micromonospora trifolii TaxID=2911208 RepID=A0ABS9N841_9ACTN|nr:PD-(D/E)XK motif protein [Micromonospora trifolii]MCG5446131.1 PD-(D/E)XK motif protein [Micromonospora trifolii]
MTGGAEEMFRRLEATDPPRQMRVLDSPVEVAAGPVAVGIDAAGRRHLLIPLTDRHPTVQDTTSRGVTVTTRGLEDDSRHSQRYADVVCDLPELNDIFAAFTDDLCQQLQRRPGDPGRVCLEVLHRWRELLYPAPGPTLGPGALIGLLAELHFLELIGGHGGAPPLDLWTGPRSARTDFTSATAAVEVKATTHRDRLVVDVHGAGQLEERPGTDLYLYVEQFERDSAGDSVPDAVDRLLATGIDRRVLLGALDAVGYRSDDADTYRQDRHRVKRVAAYHVNTPGFPRVTSAQLDAPLQQHLVRLTYSIDLSAFDHHLMDASAAAAALLDQP